MMCLMPVMGRLMAKNNPRIVATICMAFQAVGYLLLSVWSAPWGFYLSGTLQITVKDGLCNHHFISGLCLDCRICESTTAHYARSLCYRCKETTASDNELRYSFQKYFWRRAGKCLRRSRQSCKPIQFIHLAGIFSQKRSILNRPCLC